MQSDLALFMATHAMEEGKLEWSFRHATPKTFRARAGPKSHPWTGPSLLMPHPFQEESKLGILESDIATRLAWALSKSNILAGVR
jgi:hypothetical protein